LFYQARIIYGSQAALIVGFVTVTMALVIGSTFGLVAGLGSKLVDSVLMLL
jgi:peptide/nickel transport system permease protein